MSDYIPRKEILKITLPPILAVVLFIIALFAIILPNYRDNLMQQQKRMLREMTHVAWQMIAVAEKQEKSGIMSREKSREIVLDHLRGMRYGDDNLDYFWVSDLRPYMIMHPYRTDLEGKDITDYRDARGQPLFTDIIKIAKQSGQGFVSYMWQWQNDPNRIEPKLSFIKYYEPWGWIVGTGVYLNEVNQKITDLSRKLIIISVSIISLVSLLTFYMTIRALQAARSQMQAEAELRKHENHLEKLVEQRTADLTRSNQQLQEEISVRKTLEQRLFHASITDSLTGLYNRRGFFEFAEKHLQIANRRNFSLHLLYMDLDNMKDINDRFGHKMGDRALIETADILTTFFRKSDIISRLGGDEFVVLMTDHANQADQHTLAARFQQQVVSANASTHRPYKLSISVGIIDYNPDAPCSVEDLLSKGDTLMYANKKKSRQT